MHLSARAQRLAAASVAALGAGVLGLSAGGMGAIDRDLKAAEAAAPPARAELVELRCREPYDWQKETRY